MIHTENSVRTLQAIALTVGIALFLWSTGIPALFLKAEAASITNASDTLSNSAPSVASDHTIAFTVPNGMLIGATFTLTFPTAGGEFVMGSVDEPDIDILVNGTASSTAGTAANATWGVGVAGGVITFETPDDMAPASSTLIEVRIGSNAGGSNQITNPTATSSYIIEIGGTMQDSGQVRVAIIDEVTVSAAVDASLTFTVGGVAGGQAVNGTTTDAGSTNVTLPFGTLPVGQTVTLAHDLTVATNAANGFTVTVETTDDLRSSLGATINTFTNGTDVTVPGAWSSPTGAIANPDSYGHWGVTSDDAAIAARSNQFGSNQWVAATATPAAIMGHTGVADGQTAGQGATRVGYQIEISALQEAGDDYTTTLRYIATPTF
jgi:hypothetical protein